VDQGERADDDVGRVIRQRQLAQLSQVELAIGDTRRAWASMCGELSTPMTWCPRRARNSANRPVPQAAPNATPGSRPLSHPGHDRLIGREQAAARLRVVAGGLLLAGGGGADPPGEHRAVPQLLVIQQPPDLGQPGLGEFAVVIPGPGVQQRNALEAELAGGGRSPEITTCDRRPRRLRSASVIYQDPLAYPAPSTTYRSQPLRRTLRDTVATESLDESCR
jgi:hypothetical protein